SPACHDEAPRFAASAGIPLSSRHAHGPAVRRLRGSARAPSSGRPPTLGDPAIHPPGRSTRASPPRSSRLIRPRSDNKVESMTYSVAVSGASGYAGGEILRLLASHPDIEIRTVTAHSNAGQPLIDHQPHLRSLAHLTLQDTTPEILAGHDVVFLALPHGQSGQYTDALGGVPLVIDAGADHRLTSRESWDAFYGGAFHEPWTYGVPELLVGAGAKQRERL